MAWLKHRRKEKKLKERKKNLKARIELAEEILEKRKDGLPAGLRRELEEKLAAARSALSTEGENFRKKLSELRLRAEELERLLAGLE
ncbi:MAG: hypothetical protein DRI26_04040 [Chloroflexi bacterium]|nr:MAG: hypothetical protein DRI26_04040 [Chloroflexota bacterium]